MLNLYRAKDHIVAQDEKGKAIFNLKSKKDCEYLQELTKAGFDLAISHPYCVVNCINLTVESESMK